MNAQQLKQPELRSRILLAAERVFAEDGIRGAAVGRICEFAGVTNVAQLKLELDNPQDLKQALLDTLIESRLLLLNEVRWTIVDYWQEHYRTDSYHRDDSGCLDFLADDNPMRMGELLYTAFYPMGWYMMQTYPDNYWSTCLLQHNIHSPNAIFANAQQPWFSSLLYCINYAEKKLSPHLPGDGEEAMERIYFAAHQLQSLFALQESGLRAGSTPMHELRSLSLRVIQAAGRQVSGDIRSIDAEMALPDEAQREAIDQRLAERNFEIAVPRWPE